MRKDILGSDQCSGQDVLGQAEEKSDLLREGRGSRSNGGPFGLDSYQAFAAEIRKWTDSLPMRQMQTEESYSTIGQKS